MKNDSRFHLIQWGLPLALALCIMLLVWILSSFIIPYDSLKLLSLEKSTTDYDLKRLIVGLTLITVVYLWITIRFDNANKQNDQNEILDRSTVNASQKRLEVITRTLRISMAGYFSIFWVNYVPYMWFQHIDRIIGTYGLEFWSSYLSIIILGAMSIPLIVLEPWSSMLRLRKQAKPYIYMMMIMRIVVIGLISIGYFILGSMDFLYERYPIMVVVLLMLALEVFILIAGIREKRRKESVLQMRRLS